MLNYKNEKKYLRFRVANNRQDSKAPIDFTDVKTLDELNNHPNVGVRLDDLVLVDFDNITIDEANAVIKEAQKYNTIIHLTDNNIINSKLSSIEPKKPANTYGVHVFFSNKKAPNFKGNDIPLTMGINADIKTGNRSVAVVKLASYEGDRIANSEQFNIKNNFSFADLDELPIAFQGLAKQNSVKLDWEKGNRNGMWMNYTRLITNAFPEYEEDKIIDLCKEVHDRFNVGNDDYKAIVPDWLKKCAKLGRFEDTNKVYWRSNTGGLIPHKLAHSISAKLNIKSYNDKLYFKPADKTHFIINDNELKRHMYMEDGKLTDTDVSNAIKKLYNYAPKGELAENNEHLIYTPTQVLDVKNMTAKQISEDDFYLHSFNVEYNPNAYDKKLDEFLNTISLNRPGVRDDIIQALAVGITPANRRKMFMFYGSGSNGKGTLFNAFTSLFATDNSYKSIALEAIADDKFMAAQLRDRLVNVSDELDKDYLESMGTVKSLISGNEINGRDFGKAGEGFKPYVTLYLQGNMIPKTKDKSDAIKNRMIFIPMEYDGSKTNTNISVDEFYKQFTTDTAREYLFKLLVEDAQDLAYNGRGIQSSAESTKIFNTFVENNDPVLSWLNNMGKAYFIDQSRSTKLILADAKLAGLDKVTSISLNKRIQEHYKLKTKKNGWKDPVSGRYVGNTFVEDHDA